MRAVKKGNFSRCPEVPRRGPGLAPPPQDLDVVLLAGRPQARNRAPRAPAIECIAAVCSDDLNATVERLLSMGATQCQPITPYGDSGFVTASVVDPFGNVLGVMSNPHYLDVLASIRRD